MLYAALAGCVLLVLLMRQFAPEIYDVVIVHMTQRWYASVLADLDTRTSGAPVTVLDVGVGTATALVRNREAILGGKTRFVGVDTTPATSPKARPWWQALGYPIASSCTAARSSTLSCSVACWPRTATRSSSTPPIFLAPSRSCPRRWRR